jgi:hypothetical protein
MKPFRMMNLARPQLYCLKLGATLVNTRPHVRDQNGKRLQLTDHVTTPGISITTIISPRIKPKRAVMATLTVIST